MLNRSGVTSTKYSNVVQILANVDMQASVGCIVPQSLGVTVGTKKIAQAGTPINIDLMNLNVAVKATDASSSIPMNAVLLHDVDVTAGNANGTAAYFAIVNVNRLESDVQTAITAAEKIDGKSPLIVLVRG